MRKQFFDMSFGTVRLARSIFAATFFALCSLLLAPCSSAQAQQPTKPPRIGFLSAANPAINASEVEAIRLALRELGYIEGQNISFEYRFCGGKACARLSLSHSWRV